MNGIWDLYSTLIEVTIQYFNYLDFEFDTLVVNHKTLPPDMLNVDDIERFKGRFKKMAANTTVNSNFKVTILND